MTGGARIGVDIGGTFTDIVLALPDGTVRVSKASSTPHDPGAAVVSGVAALLRAASVPPAAVAEVVHGTTVASNTILQKRGARTGLLTTRGFRDVLEIGRIRTPDLYDLTWDKPEPLVPRRHRQEVDERVAADGTVVQPMDDRSVLAAAEQLVADGVTAVAVCFLNSHANPAHEREAERLLRDRYAELDVTASYRVQGSELTIPVPEGRLDPAAVAGMRRAFAAEYATTYGYASDEELELVNLRVVATGRRASRLGFEGLRSTARPAAPAPRARPVSFTRGADPVVTPVVERETIGAAPVAGPIVIETYDSTVAVPPGSTVRADAHGNLLIEIGE